MADCNAALQQEGTDLVDDAGTQAYQALAHAMQCLQVQLIGCLGSDELHGWALDSFSDCSSASRKSAFCHLQIDKVKQRFELSHVVLVGDRGMITQARIER